MPPAFRFKNFLLSLALLAVVATAVTTLARTGLPWHRTTPNKIYRDERFGVSVILPDGWEVLTHHSPFGDAVFFNPRMVSPRALQSSPEGSVTYAISHLGSTTSTLSEIAHAYRRFGQYGLRYTTVAGQPAFEQRLYYPAPTPTDPGPFHSRDVYVDLPGLRGGRDYFAEFELFYPAQYGSSSSPLDQAFEFMLANITFLP